MIPITTTLQLFIEDTVLLCTTVTVVHICMISMTKKRIPFLFIFYGAIIAGVKAVFSRARVVC